MVMMLFNALALRGRLVSPNVVPVQFSLLLQARLKKQATILSVFKCGDAFRS